LESAAAASDAHIRAIKSVKTLGPTAGFVPILA
jgi:hypothetical protein